MRRKLKWTEVAERVKRGEFVVLRSGGGGGCGLRDAASADGTIIPGTYFDMNTFDALVSRKLVERDPVRGVWRAPREQGVRDDALARARVSRVKTPQCDAWAAVADEFKAVMEFIAYCVEQERDPTGLTDYGVEKIFCEMKGIDVDKRERERRALLDATQKASAS